MTRLFQLKHLPDSQFYSIKKSLSQLGNNISSSSRLPANIELMELIDSAQPRYRDAVIRDKSGWLPIERISIGLYSPRLDKYGNSVRAIAACRDLAEELGLMHSNVPTAARAF